MIHPLCADFRVAAAGLDFDQFVRSQRMLDFLLDCGGQSLISDHHHGLKRVRTTLQKFALRNGERRHDSGWLTKPEFYPISTMKRTKSGGAWMREHVTDPFVRKAQQDGYRSRAAYKLLEIDKRDRLLRPGMAVVDLGAAPGSWCQVVTQRLKAQGRILAIDLLPIATLPGVEILQGDFMDDGSWLWLQDKLQGTKLDLVLSDMAPNISGIAMRDQARHYELCEMALAFSEKWLKPDGAILVKVFQGQGFEQYRDRVRRVFKDVQIRKPEASRNRSNELFLLGRSLRL